MGGSVGVLLGGGQGVRIGGTAAGERNIISGNAGDGIRILPRFFTRNNSVRGNFIGTDVTGTADLGNSGNGVSISSIGVSFDFIEVTDNIISGNDGNGIQISTLGHAFISVSRNLIGTDMDGAGPLGNSLHGVFIDSEGAGGLSGNTIALNGGDGVFVNSSRPSSIKSNSIFSNGGLGIDLAPVGVTPNDPGDGDSGANDLQNFPVLSSAECSSQGTKIEGTLNSTPNTAFTLEFFSNSACDPSGFGEGQQFLGSTSVTTGENGDAEFDVTFETIAPAGSFITSTASGGPTSEFSQCIEVESDTAPPQVTIDASKTMLWPPNHDLVDVGFTYTVQDNSDPNPALSIGVTSNQPAQDPVTGDVFSAGCQAGQRFVWQGNWPQAARGEKHGP